MFFDDRDEIILTCLNETVVGGVVCLVCAWSHLIPLCLLVLSLIAVCQPNNQTEPAQYLVCQQTSVLHVL